MNNNIQLIETKLEQSITEPAKISFPVVEAKKLIEEFVETYKNMVYTEKNVDFAIKDKKKLSDLVKKLETYAKETDKELSADIKKFREDFKMLVSIITDILPNMQKQIDKVEDDRIAAKKNELNEIIAEGYANLEIELKYQTIEIRDKWLLKSTTKKSINEEVLYDLRECLNKQQQHYQNVEMIKTLVELSNAKYQLNVHIDATTFVNMLEYKDITTIKESITSTAERQAEQEKAYAEKVEREAQEKAQREIDLANIQAQKEIEKANAIAQQKVEELVIQNEKQIEEMVEFVASQVKIEEPVKTYDKSAPKKLFRFEANLTKEQFNGLSEWFKNNGVNAKVV